MKTAFAGFDLFDTAMEALAEHSQLTALFTCPVDQEFEHNRRVIGLAEKLSIPWTDKPISREDLMRLRQEGCDLLVSAGYYYRIPVDEKLPMVNFHPSLLPEGRGAWPMPVMLLSGMDTGGITAHKLAADFDQGDILLRRSFPIGKDENLEEVTGRIRRLLPDMVKELLENLEGLYAGAVPQQGGSYWKCPREEDYPLSPEMTVEEADRILRAFYGFGCIYRSGGKGWQLVRGRAYPASAGEGIPDGAFRLRDGWILAEGTKEFD